MTSPIAAARAFGMPYDPARIELFELLFRELQQIEFKKRPDKNVSIKASVIPNDFLFSRYD